MPFVRPAIHVYQQLMTVTPRTVTPFFELCLVGPSYQVVRNAQFPDYKASNAPSYSTPYVSKEALANVIPSSIAASMTNLTVQVWPDSTSTVGGTVKVSNEGTATVVYSDSATAFTAAGVKVGDFVDVIYNGLTYTSAIQSIASATQLVNGASVSRETLTLQKNIPTPIVAYNTVAGSTTTTVKFSVGANNTVDYYKGMTVAVGGEEKVVTGYAYSAGTGTLTLESALATAPSSGVEFTIKGVGVDSAIFRPVVKKVWPMRFSTTSVGSAAVADNNGVTRLSFVDGTDLGAVKLRDSIRIVYTRGTTSDQYLSEVSGVSNVSPKYIDLADKIPTPGSGVTVAVYVTTSEYMHSVTLDNSGGLSKITTDVGAKFSSAGVAVKDKVRLYSGATEYLAEVYAVSEDGRTLTLSTNVGSGSTYSVVQCIINRNEVDLYNLRPTEYTAGADTFAVNNQIALVVDQKARLIYSASVFMDYKALRAGNGDFIQVSSAADALAKFGKIDPENPMAIACAIVQSNSGVPFKVLPVSEDSTLGYLGALDTLTTTEKVYVIVPLTQDKDVISAYAAHCTTMSAPEKSKFRIMYANLPLPVSKVMVELNQGSLAPGGDDYFYLKDTVNGVFVTNRTAAGDYVELFAPGTVPTPLGDEYGNEYALKVTQVVNDTVAKVSKVIYVKNAEGYTPTTSLFTLVPDNGAEQTVSYEVRRTLSNSGIAEEMVAIAKSFSNKRVRLVSPDQVAIAIDGVDYVLPGYYLCCAYGAMRAGLPPHQGFTTLGVSGITRILHSNKKFKDTELDEMAGGGIFWVVQDEPEALPYCIYQTTTDTTQLETIEDSVVATIDYASMYYKSNLKSVLGKFNVNEISTKYVATIIKDISEKLMRTSYPYIGSILTEGTLKSITASGDKITPVVTVKVPFPVNAVDLYLQI